MSAESWIADNNRYLAASLQWLRLRLQELATPTSSPAAAQASPAPIATTAVVVAGPAAAPVRTWFGQKQAAPAPSPAAAPTAGSADVLLPPEAAADRDAQLLDAAANEREAAARCDPPPTLLLLAARLRLSSFERDTLLMCAAAELDPAIGPLFAAAAGHPARSYPTFALAMHAFDEPTWDSLAPQHPLRGLRLVEVVQAEATPMTASPLRADERIVNYIKGLNALDERLAALASAVPAARAAGLSASQRTAVDDALARLRSDSPEARAPTLVLAGPDPASKLAVATAVCQAIDRQLYRLGLEALPVQRAEAENLARLWRRESALLAVALYVDAEGLDGASAEAGAALAAFVAAGPALVFVGVRDGVASLPGASPAIDVGRPTADEQRASWNELFAGALPADQAAAGARRLAGQFDFNLDDIALAASLAQQAAGDATLADRAWDSCRSLARPRLDALAQRIVPKATWDDLVLSDESLRLLNQIVAHVRGRFQVFEDWGYARKMARGFGLGALFAGESGTGKTMAAEVLANELRLHLYRIDLSAVVSKYIGETEKNLRRLFDAAEQGGAILFFDEADALFGKRSEVKDSHDRYANIEINYLLQRMEAFGGLAVLATNMKTALDPAFMRRLRFVVNFPFPGPAQRQQMWRKVFPRELPQRDLDYAQLARFNLSGGNIHSIALNAAFAAADRDGVITQPLLLSAVRTELRKLDKPVNEAEFR